MQITRLWARSRVEFSKRLLVPREQRGRLSSWVVHYAFFKTCIQFGDLPNRKRGNAGWKREMRRSTCALPPAGNRTSSLNLMLWQKCNLYVAITEKTITLHAHHHWQREAHSVNPYLASEQQYHIY